MLEKIAHNSKWTPWEHGQTSFICLTGFLFQLDSWWFFAVCQKETPWCFCTTLILRHWRTITCRSSIYLIATWPSSSNDDFFFATYSTQMSDFYYIEMKNNTIRSPSHQSKEYIVQFLHLLGLLCLICLELKALITCKIVHNEQTP